MIPFTVLQNINLHVSGRTHSAADNSITTLWYRNGGYLPLGSQVGLLKRPFLSFSQSLTLQNSSILDVGTYEAQLTIDTYTHFNSHLGCHDNYYQFLSYTLGVYTIILAQAKVQLKYYGKFAHDSLCASYNDQFMHFKDNIASNCIQIGILLFLLYRIPVSHSTSQ